MELTPRSAKRLTDAPNIAHGLPFVGELGGRDSHSSAFFSTPRGRKNYTLAQQRSGHLQLQLYFEISRLVQESRTALHQHCKRKVPQAGNQRIAIDSLKSNPRNARTHWTKQTQQIAESIKQ
jgi:hypothetical protein